MQLLVCPHRVHYCYVRVAEHSSELQKEDSEKEIEALQEESRRLREERVRLQAQLQEDQHINAEMQEQLQQLTKHVKVNHTSTSGFHFRLWSLKGTVNVNRKSVCHSHSKCLDLCDV